MTLFARTKYGKMHYMYASQRGSSKKRGMKMPSYSKAEFIKWLESQPLFDILFKKWESNDFNRMEAPSVDRIDDSKPYSMDNIQLMSFRENNSKSHKDRKDGVIVTSQNRAVIQLTRDGEFVSEFYSASAAARSVNAGSRSKISEVCLGKRKTAYNYKWAYKDESQGV